MKRSLIAVALFAISIPALADQQCSYIGQQVVCRDMPSYRDAQVNAQIPLMGNNNNPDLVGAYQRGQQIRQQNMELQLMQQNMRSYLLR
jgi:hypothetical protein